MFNREIYGPYFNGEEQLFADPLSAYRKLIFHLDGKPRETVEESKSEDVEVSYPAKEKLVEAARAAFYLAPFNPRDGSGARDEDAWVVLVDFLNWVTKKKVRVGS